MLLQTGRSYRTLSFVLFCLAVTALAQTPNKFPYGEKDMQFNAKPVERDIDRKCVPEGTGSDEGQRAQNRSKNRFDAQGTPIPILISDFDSLEKATVRARNCWAKHLANCKMVELNKVSGLPANRDQLKDIAKTASGQTIGEGTLVVFEAQVLDSHYSNTKYNIYFNNHAPSPGDGESVNCKKLPGFDSSAIDSNDIHIVLVAPGVTDDCMSVTAEISPHFRPASWRRFHDMGVNQLGQDVNSEAKGVDFKKLQLVRITGPLFYDASHEPCSPGKRSSPARRSLWEIHPAYKLEVKSKGQWMSFDDWAKTQ
ncbi:MAG: hypothetical protein QOC99_2594 [Acidobacteriota bacterium]|jgi:hypothetical protein|nr:hypothetical protein [Acidobacteriota bacterium]